MHCGFNSTRGYSFLSSLHRKFENRLNNLTSISQFQSSDAIEFGWDSFFSWFTPSRKYRKYASPADAVVHGTFTFANNVVQKLLKYVRRDLIEHEMKIEMDNLKEIHDDGFACARVVVKSDDTRDIRRLIDCVFLMQKRTSEVINRVYSSATAATGGNTFVPTVWTYCAVFSRVRASKLWIKEIGKCISDEQNSFFMFFF